MSFQNASLADPAADFSGQTFDQKLDLYAQVAVKVGLNLRKGQDLLIAASIESLPLVRRITEHAYKAGAPLVITFFSDEECTLARYRFAADDTFDHAPQWMVDSMAAAYRSGTARLSISGANPALLAGQDPAKVSRASSAMSKAAKESMELLTKHVVNWSVVASATPDWAKLVFPGVSVDDAVERLWDAIFYTSRITGVDPVKDWFDHVTSLERRVELLNAKRYHALHFTSTDGGTDLTVGLADDHLWCGGGSRSANGIFHCPNIPTEECFTTPHMSRVDGIVKASKPLSAWGTLIENIVCRFEGGRVVEATATAGEDVLRKMIDTDEGARRLGEVALVPNSSPIAQSGVLFYNTLFDENAASHIALGQSYATCIIGGENKSPTDLSALGANTSLIHVDWMIGSGAMNVDGQFADGGSEPLMRGGDWV